MERDASHNLSVLAQRQLRLIPILVRTLLRFVQINKGATRVAPCLIQFVNRPCFVESQHRDKSRICTDDLCKQLVLLNMAEEPLGFLLHRTVCLSVLFSNARIQVVVVESFLSKSPRHHERHKRAPRFISCAFPTTAHNHPVFVLHRERLAIRKCTIDYGSCRRHRLVHRKRCVRNTWLFPTP